ncbi:hypothetical protein KO02_09450 [Sphingobacterium sp. ML3W]|uniref:hypothetical protein n=1 Tax=Sphingobacterium sp. ML3W TaxID=1538644 RepID=UPI0004F61BED|nr:hypothetical protein [Sphingobacterium sp. ML3W]AIM36891.1 hypothetical protein KO02_09450 [Sphingobacterium sp. ML3W]
MVPIHNGTATSASSSGEMMQHFPTRSAKAMISTSVSYIYDVIGTKLQKKSTIGTINSSRDYVRGIEYKGADIDIIHNGVGYALKSGTNYVYHYNLTDHLGNVRAMLKRGGTATAVDVTQRDNYSLEFRFNCIHELDTFGCISVFIHSGSKKL